MDFPVEKPTTVRTSFSMASGRIFALLFAFFAGLVVFKGASLIDPLGPYLPMLLSPLAAFCLYKLTSSSIRNKAYDCLTFMSDSLVVHYTYKPELKIFYKDIVGVAKDWEFSTLSLILTGNYPIMLLQFYRLENNAEKKFVDYLHESGRV